MDVLSYSSVTRTLGGLDLFLLPQFAPHMHTFIFRAYLL